MDMYEKLRIAVEESRKQQRAIDELIESTRNESRPIIIEENKQKLEQMIREHKEYDEMTQIDYEREIIEINKRINHLFVRKAQFGLSEEMERGLQTLLDRRAKLLELARNNSDILYLTGAYGKDSSPEPTPEPEIDPENPQKDPGKKGAGDGGKKDIEEKIKKYQKQSESLRETIIKIREKLILNIGVDITITELIKGLDDEIKALNEVARKLIEEIDIFKTKAFGEEPSLTVVEIKKQIEEFKKQIAELKRLQIERYNAQVDYINIRITELKGMDPSVLTPEIIELINKLSTIDRCVIEIRTYKDVKYLNEIDYNKLLEIYKLLIEIDKKLAEIKKGPAPSGGSEDVIDFEAAITEIETKIIELQGIDNLEDEDVLNQFKEDIAMLEIKITEFIAKLKVHSDKLTKEQYEAYIKRATDAQTALNALKDKITKGDTPKPEPTPEPDPDKKEEDEFKKLKGELDLFAKKLLRFAIDIDTFKGKLTIEAKDDIQERINQLREELETIKTRIEESHNNNKIDDTQYESLIKYYNDLKAELDKCAEKALAPEMYKEVVTKEANAFDFLDIEIRNLKDRIASLMVMIEKAPNPIKSKQTRRTIETIIDKLEKEIEIIRTHLENHKDEDRDRYSKLVADLKDREDELNQAREAYKSKCPLGVKFSKGAKSFYKKYKKPILIGTGLAAIALTHATIGPVCAPAIIWGNRIIGNKLPGARPTMKVVNNALRKLIGAKEVQIDGVWYTQLANGNLLGLDCTNHLIKGIAAVGLGSAPVVIPAIYGITKLAKKIQTKAMERKELKERNKNKKPFIPNLDEPTPEPQQQEIVEAPHEAPTPPEEEVEFDEELFQALLDENTDNQGKRGGRR